MKKLQPATVYIVGAGPGDAGLLTLRGAACLRRADLVLYDYLVNPLLLDHARADAQRVCLGQHGRGRMLSVEDVTEQMIEAARTGKTVVRLKAGDPVIFARAAEELDALQRAGVPFVIVPGVTAALASGSYAGVPLTDREASSCVALITGQQRADGGEGQGGLDFEALAQFPGTLVFYMGVTTAEGWSQSLIAAGKSPDTAVAAVRRCSFPDQQTHVCRLDEVADWVKHARLRPPVIFIVGDVVRGQRPTWFTERPLFGRTVLVTRPTLGRLRDRGRDVRALCGVQLAAIGPATATALAASGLRADMLPKTYHSEALAEALAPLAWGKRLLIARSNRGREVLARELEASGGDVEQVVVYESRDVTHPDAGITEALTEGAIDWVTVTSSAIATSLDRLFGDDLTKTKLAAISSLTANALADCGHRAAVVAEEATTEGLVMAIRKAESAATSR